MAEPNERLAQIIRDAQTTQSKLRALWADEGVEQLEIFLDPGISEVLVEIKRVTMDFIDRLAAEQV